MTVGTQSSAGVTFTVTVPAPVISRLDPDSGPVDSSVTIEGSNFGTSGTVTFNGTTASTTSWDTDEIETSVPSGATTGAVVVTVGTQSSAGVNFTVTIPTPVISRLDPDSGPVDTEVRIHGSNFGSQTGSVTFNGVTASPTHWNHDIIRVRVPEGATDGPVVVTTSAGKSSAGVTFTVTPPPARADHLPAGSRFRPRRHRGHHPRLRFRHLGYRDLQRNERFHLQLGKRRDSDARAGGGHHGTGGGDGG